MVKSTKPSMKIFNPYTAVCLGWQLMLLAFVILRVLPYAFPYVSNNALAKQIAQRVWDESDLHYYSMLNEHQLNSAALHIAVAADEHSLGGLVAVVNSVQSHTNRTILFHLITDHESEDHLREWMRQPRLSRIYHDITVFNTSLVSQYLKTEDGYRDLTYPLSYAYYYLPQLYPHLDGRLIYLDHDVIVQHDIAELNSTFMDPGHIVALSDDCQSFSVRPKSMERTYAGYLNFNNANVRQTGMRAATCSFNTGVMVIDMKQWRAKNITQKLEKWLMLNTMEDVFGRQKAAGGSQAPMMIVFYKNYANIEPVWHVRNLGVTAGTSYSSEFISQAKLIHWNGNFKPWGRVSQHSEIWNRYYVDDPLLKFKPIRKY